MQRRRQYVLTLGIRLCVPLLMVTSIGWRTSWARATSFSSRLVLCSCCFASWDAWSTLILEAARSVKLLRTGPCSVYATHSSLHLRRYRRRRHAVRQHRQRPLFRSGIAADLLLCRAPGRAPSCATFPDALPRTLPEFHASGRGHRCGKMPMSFSSSRTLCAGPFLMPVMFPAGVCLAT